MLSITNSASMARALDSPIDPALKNLLTLRRDQLIEHDGYDLSDLAHFVVVLPGDSLSQIEAALGFSPMVNIVDGKRSGQPGFVPSFEWVEDHGGWMEAPFIMSDDGFGYVLIIENREGVDPELLSLCREYAHSRKP